MKKNTITSLIILVPFFSFSQSVIANLYDKFERKQRVETAAMPFDGLAFKTKLSVSFTALDSALYLTVSGAGWGTTTVDSGDELKLLFSNDSVITLKSTALQGFEPGMLQNSYRHQYLVDAYQLDALTKYSLVNIRKYSFATFTDLEIPQQNTGKLKGLTALFVAELKKANRRILRHINVKDIRNYIGDSVQFCSKVFKTRYFQGSAESPTLLDVQSDFFDPLVNVVILQKDRQKFNGAPEKKYLNREVCISGVVSLRNNIPYVVIGNREQIKVKSPVDLADIELYAGDSITVTGNMFTVHYPVNAKTSPTIEVAMKSERASMAKKTQSQTAVVTPASDSANFGLGRKETDKLKGLTVDAKPIAEKKENASVAGTNSRTAGKPTGVRYKVRSKAYFHNEPNESTRRKAFIVHWNNAILQPTNEENDFVYIVFTNHLGQVSKGWLSKDDLIVVR